MNKRDFLRYVLDCTLYVFQNSELTQINLSRTCSTLREMVKNVPTLIRQTFYKVTDFGEVVFNVRCPCEFFWLAEQLYHKARWGRSLPFACTCRTDSCTCTYARYGYCADSCNIIMRCSRQVTEEIHPNDFFKPYVDSWLE
jgi:hypothetical protein